MSRHGRASWLPWRSSSPVRWTLVLALCVVAVIAAGVPSEWRTASGRPAGWWTASVPPVATWAALLALVLAILPTAEQRRTATWPWRPWPWRGPDPLRNTAAFLLQLLALAVILAHAVTLSKGYFLLFPIFYTLMLASAVASTRGGRSTVTAWAFGAGFSWGLYLSSLR